MRRLHKTLQTGYGTIHYWIVCPDKEKSWLIFLPGLTADHHLFDKQILELGKEYNCLVWDAPAHGLSRPFELKFTMDDLARYLQQILDREDISHPVLIGQSLGGYISQVYMEIYPENAAGFVSIDSCPLQREYYTGVEIFLLKHTKAMYMSFPWKALVKIGSDNNAMTDYGRKVMYRTMRSYDKKEYCELADYGFRIFAHAVECPRAYEIPCPVLLICGEKDAAGSAKRYNRKWEQREEYPMIWIPNAGHGSNMDAPEIVNQVIQKFVQTSNYNRRER